ncbi:MAG: radical SAM protein [Chlamydiota bacterium]
MNVLLLNPPFLDRYSRASRSPAVAKGGTIYYPIWLAYAAGVLEQSGHAVRLIDAPAECIGNPDVAARLGGWTPDLVVLDTSTPSIHEDARSADFYKERYPRSAVVMVGTHPSAMPDWTLGLTPAIGAVARGEYDYTLRDLCEALTQGRGMDTVAGLSFRDAGGVRHTPPRPLIDDLDALPFVTSVCRRHLDVRNYFFAAARYPMVMTISGRGCPHRCFFCVYPQTFHGRAYRPRSPGNVVEEFRFVREHLPAVNEIGFEDDTFTADRRRCAEICDRLIAERWRLPWYCNARADLPFDLMVKMRRAGCRLIVVGFESGSQAVLDAMHKGIGVETMRRFARDAKRAGLLIHGCIMAGNPGETEETLAESFRFARELNCDSMQFFPLIVYPGTEAYAWAVKTGALAATDFRDWLDEKGDYRCVINLPGLPSERLVALCRRYYLGYHLRPAYLLAKLRQAVARPGEMVRTARAALKYARYLLRDRAEAWNRPRGDR